MDSTRPLPYIEFTGNCPFHLARFLHEIMISHAEICKLNKPFKLGKIYTAKKVNIRPNKDIFTNSKEGSTNKRFKNSHTNWPLKKR